MAKSNGAAQKPMTKTEIMATLAENTGLTKKQVASVFEELAKLIGKNLGRRGPGIFNVRGRSTWFIRPCAVAK